ncbi:hypothetical protein ACFPVS_04635 [Neisseria weixii]
MAFSQEETESLLSVKGVGPTVIRRLGKMRLDDTQNLLRQQAV